MSAPMNLARRAALKALAGSPFAAKAAMAAAEKALPAVTTEEFHTPQPVSLSGQVVGQERTPNPIHQLFRKVRQEHSTQVERRNPHSERLARFDHMKSWSRSFKARASYEDDHLEEAYMYDEDEMALVMTKYLVRRGVLPKSVLP